MTASVWKKAPSSPAAKLFVFLFLLLFSCDESLWNISLQTALGEFQQGNFSALAAWAEGERPGGELHGLSAEAPYLLGLHFYQQSYPHIAEELWSWDIQTRFGPWTERSREDLTELYIQQRRYTEAEAVSKPFQNSAQKPQRRLYFQTLYWQRKNSQALEEMARWMDFEFSSWEYMENLLFEGVLRIREGDNRGAAQLWLLYSGYWENNLHKRGAGFFAEDEERLNYFDAPQALWIQAKSSWSQGEREKAWDHLTDLAEINPPWFTQGMVLAEWSYWARELNRVRSADDWLEDLWETNYRRSYAYGRLKVQSGEHSTAAGAFRRSLTFTQDPGLRDSSLLYLLRSAKEISLDALIEVLEDFSPSDPSKLDVFWDEARVELVGNRDWKSLGRLNPYLEQWASDWVRAEWAFWQAYWPEGTQEMPVEDYANPYNIGVALGDLADPELTIPEEGPSYYKEEWRPTSQEEQKLAAYVRFGLWPEAFRLLKNTKDGFSPELRWTVIRSFEDYQQYHYAISLWQDLWDEGYRSREVFQGLFPLAYQEIIQDAAQEAGLPVSLLYGLVREESRFNAKAGSHAGAQGLSQLMPATAEDVARRIKLQDYDVHIPADNLKIGAWYLAHRLDQFGNGSKALMAYNAGSGRVRRWEREWVTLTPQQYVLAVPIKETRRYVLKVLVSALWYSKLYGFEDPETIIRIIF